MKGERPSSTVEIRNEDITLVFQGELHAAMMQNIARCRKVLPGAKVVVSALNNADVSDLRGADLDLILSDDPGALPPYKRGRRAPLNNVNRQIATSRAGLARVTSKYAAKIRTDCVLHSRAFVGIYERMMQIDKGQDRLLASSIYTLHPEGIEAFPFHLSDWFFFGATKVLRAYYDAPFMTREDALWFDGEQKYPKGSNYFARRYRARFAPEQYLAVEFAKKKGGYKTPNFLNDSCKQVRIDYLRFLSNDCVVCDPNILGLQFEKYAHASRSNFQFFNCVWGSDWQNMCKRVGVFANELDDSQEPFSVNLGGPSDVRRRTVVQAMRRLDVLLPFIKTVGLMPLVGDLLGFYRKL